MDQKSLCIKRAFNLQNIDLDFLKNYYLNIFIAKPISSFIMR